MPIPPIKRYFTYLALGLGVASLPAAVATPGFDMQLIQKFKTPQPLTKNEVAFIKQTYGKEMDPSLIRKRLGGCQAPQGAIMEAGLGDDDTIYICHPRFLSADYTLDKDPERFRAFFHETTHRWQAQTAYAYTKGRCREYFYPLLSSENRFGDYCDEQQGAIMEDYALRFLFPGGAPSHWYSKKNGGDNKKSDARLKKLVEDRFPGIRGVHLK